jgi:DNA-binding transcriptional LysR family regulator
MLNLLKVCQYGSINRAAEALNISQPALTRSIARLEDSLGVELLERNAKGVVPTPFGELLLVHARNIESELKTTLQGFETLRKGRQKTIGIGATPLVSAYFMPVALTALHERHPDVSLRLVDAHRPELLGLLRRRELDLVVATVAFDSEEADLVQQPLFDLTFHVIVRSDHPLAQLATVRIADLASFKWILPYADSGLYRRVEQDFVRAGVEFPGVILETTSAKAIKALVASTDLIGVMPLQALAELSSDNIISLNGDWSFTKRSVGMYMRNEHENPAIVRSLARALQGSGKA